MGMLLERRLLQLAYAVAAIVPVYAGLSGVIHGAAFASGGPVSVALDSHVRYLSGLLLAIGLAIWSAIPRIERRTQLIRLLTILVFAGGLARAFGLARTGWPGAGMGLGLGMELVVTPLLCLWQARIARNVPARRYLQASTPVPASGHSG
jgi:uncharacterized protein DUF4345